MDDEIALEKKLNYLMQKQRELDDYIDALAAEKHNEFETKRKKREKLQINDQIVRIRQELYPDIIA